MIDPIIVFTLTNGTITIYQLGFWNYNSTQIQWIIILPCSYYPTTVYITNNNLTWSQPRENPLQGCGKLFATVVQFFSKLFDAIIMIYDKPYLIEFILAFTTKVNKLLFSSIKLLINNYLNYSKLLINPQNLFGTP